MWSRPVAGTMTGVRALELPWWPLAAAMAAVLLAIPFARLALRSRRRGREARDPHRAAEQEAARREAIEREAARVEDARRRMTEQIAARQAEIEREARRLDPDARRAASEAA
ncbi:MAG TPA: hypothetical protein VKY91_06175, partial [Vulgatibacteraceae bacterium]|nr:hypothetical protein [Vulgatibacteraceae bacterium]